MSFMGKILVVLQLFLSVFFMMFAGAVYSAHVNWRNEAEKQKKAVVEKTSALAAKTTELDDTKNKMTEEVNKAKGEASKAEIANAALKQQVDDLIKKNRDLTTALSTQSELAQIAQEEAVTRRNETLALREINEKLLGSRDEQFKEKTVLEDNLRSMNLDFNAAQQKVKDLLVQMSRSQSSGGTVEGSGPEGVMSVGIPPRVDGKIVLTKAARSQGNAELVEISLGSDDGLSKGHEMVVYRSAAENGGKAKYLGKIRIVFTTPDKAVGTVLEKSKSGIIQKGDNVTTRL